MLDFYWHPDEEGPRDSPDEARHLGSLSLDEHKALACVWREAEARGVALPFFRDTRLRAADVGVLSAARERCSSGLGVDSVSLKALRTLDSILAGAIERGAGVSTFCD